MSVKVCSDGVPDAPWVDLGEPSSRLAAAVALCEEREEVLPRTRERESVNRPGVHRIRDVQPGVPSLAGGATVLRDMRCARVCHPHLPSLGTWYELRTMRRA